MNKNCEFYEIDLRSDNNNNNIVEDNRVVLRDERLNSAKVHSFFNSALRKTFLRKNRRVTSALITRGELTKNNISSPINVSALTYDEDEFINNSKNTIECCPFDISGYGDFLLMDEFKVQKPEKMKLMVFLYEKIIIFTKKQLNEESYYYMGSIKMDHIGLLPQNKNKRMLSVKDHFASRRYHKETLFYLEAHSEYIQLHWKKTIETCLWSQLLKAKKDGGLFEQL